MSELTDNKIKEWQEKFCHKVWYNPDLPNGFVWQVRETAIDGDMEQWLTQAFEETEKAVAKDAMDIVNKTDLLTDDVALAYRMGYGAAKMNIEEAISKRYRVWAKYRLKGETKK